MPCCRPEERKHRAPVPSCGERGFLDFEMGTATETEEDTPAFASSSIARGVGEDRLYGGMGDQDRGWGIDRKSVVEGKSVYVRVDLGGRGIIKKHKKRIAK